MFNGGVKVLTVCMCFSGTKLHELLRSSLDILNNNLLDYWKEEVYFKYAILVTVLQWSINSVYLNGEDLLYTTNKMCSSALSNVTHGCGN